MSLNGLDDAAVVDAYQAALAEAGGWQVAPLSSCACSEKLTISQYRFLLKYASRDTVELLGKGTAGVSEARLAVEEYEEKSPLYGLVQYRRRKVILKYVPEGTSRLLQGLLRIHRCVNTIDQVSTQPGSPFNFNQFSKLSRRTKLSFRSRQPPN